MKIKQPRYDDVFYEGVARMDADALGELDMPESILREAERTINGERQDAYGKPEDSFKIIAELWTAYLHGAKALGVTKQLSAIDVAHMMTLFKIARMLGQKPCRDNYVDAAGYLAIAGDRMLSHANHNAPMMPDG